MSQDFTHILNSLNPRQREAVETIYGPVMVIAWPGSGKTQLLAARIANILHTTDYLPSNILCLTFTENAAKNMRERLARMIGGDAYRVAIHTFHSFGNEILNQYRYYFREFEDATTIDDIRASKILDEILENLEWNDPYKPRMNASDTIREILSSIANLKKWWITPVLFGKILETNKRELESLSPLLSETFEKIESLWNKKEGKEKKIELFLKFTEMVQQLSINTEKYGNYESLTEAIYHGLESSLASYEGDLKIQFISKWKESWTTKNHKDIRIWKETEKLKKQQSLAHIYTLYSEKLEELGYIDFSDMILRAIELVEQDPMIQSNLAERYQFILIDEFQDTNEAQMRLVHSILHASLESPNIFAVWDDDQSIYKFQWANIKNIRDFYESWNDTKLIILDTNYRSHSEIISSSRAVIKSEMSDISKIFPWAVKEFFSIHGEGGKVAKYRFNNELQEVEWIIDDIHTKIKQGKSPESIAVITKKNKSLETLAKWLLWKNIPVSMSKTESIFESELIILIINILKYLESLKTRYPANEILVDIISHPAWNIPRIELWKLSRDIYHARKEENKSWIERLTVSDISEIRDVGYFIEELAIKSEIERLEDIIDIITGANSLSLPTEEDEEWLTNQLQIGVMGGEKKAYISPLYQYFFGQLSNNNWTYERSTEQARHLTNIKKCIDTIRSYKWGKPFLMLEDAIEILELIEKYNIRIETSQIIGNAQKSVNLITVHKAKWLEWDEVYIPHLHKREYKLGKIGGSPLPKNLPLEADRDDDEDIERLVYTAYTRAKIWLSVTYSEEDISERSNEPLACIELESQDWLDGPMIENNLIVPLLEDEKKSLFSLPYLGEERAFLQDRIEKQFIMSATALQNFLNIIDAGPEYFISNNILRFPQAKNIAAAYGTAIHAWLEDFFNDYKKTGSYQKKILHDRFEESLKKDGFPEATETEWLARGHDNIEALYTEITGRSYGDLSLEEDFRTTGGGVFLGDIQITGKIDRIERLADDSLIITDYKTGGGFDSFSGTGTPYEKLKQWKYRLQLAFYAVLFELSPRWRMFHKRQYELFFVEKNQKEDRFHRVLEYVHDGEIERTKSLIRAVSQCISTLHFPDISKYEKTIDGIRQFEEDLINWQI